MKIDREIIPGAGMIVHYDKNEINFDQLVKSLNNRVKTDPLFQNSIVEAPEVHHNICQIFVAFNTFRISLRQPSVPDQVFRAIKACLKEAKKS